MIKKYLSNQRGVTLIELLAVIVILGILAAIAVPAVLDQVDKAEDAAIEANEMIIKDAADRYFIMEDPDGGTVTLKTLKEKGYLKDIPEDFNEDDIVNDAGDINP